MFGCLLIIMPVFMSAYRYIVCACLLLLSHVCLLSVLLHEHCIVAYDMLRFKLLHLFICVSVQHSHFRGNGRVSRLSRGSGGNYYNCASRFAGLCLVFPLLQRRGEVRTNVGL